jgi:hypothetical protein
MTVSCIVCGRCHGDTWDRKVGDIEEAMCLSCWVWATGAHIQYAWVQAMKACKKAMRRYDE